MSMDQRAVAILGIALVVVALLYPPWILTATGQVSLSAGWAPVWRGPVILRAPSGPIHAWEWRQFTQLSSEDPERGLAIDHGLLATELLAVALVAIGGIASLHKGKW
jgi:hypothetical protein